MGGWVSGWVGGSVGGWVGESGYEWVRVSEVKSGR